MRILDLNSIAIVLLSSIAVSPVIQLPLVLMPILLALSLDLMVRDNLSMTIDYENMVALPANENGFLIAGVWNSKLASIKADHAFIHTTFKCYIGKDYR